MADFPRVDDFITAVVLGPKAADRLRFVPRLDGKWDYFPQGFSQPGYVVDDAVKARLLDAEQRARSQRFASKNVLLGILLLAYLHFGQSDLGIAAGPTAGVVVAIAILGALPIGVVVWWIYRRVVGRTLSTTSPTDRTISPEEARDLRARTWDEVPRSRKRTAFVLAAIGAGAAAFSSYQNVAYPGRFSKGSPFSYLTRSLSPSLVSSINGSLLALWSLLLVAFIIRGVQLARGRARHRSADSSRA